jgi:hypothetical protein
MKLFNPLVTATLALTFGLQILSASANAAPLETNFSYAISFELGKSNLKGGDEITITSVRGDRAHLEPGGNYLVQGHYTLASADAASLALFCTTDGSSGSTPVTQNQEIKITRGSQDFLLSEIACDGWLHLSFYPADGGNSLGGIYFGEKGVERTVLRNKEFTPQLRKLKKPGTSATGMPEERNDSKTDSLSHGHATYGPNHAIMQFLGSPVLVPGDLDAKYNSQSLMVAFTAAAKTAKRNIKMLSVDDSEFPFLVYGVLGGRYDGGQAFTDALHQMEGYDYGGAVSGSTDSAATFFAYNITPHKAYPPYSEEQCNRRLMVRLQMLAQRAQEWEQLNAR